MGTFDELKAIIAAKLDVAEDKISEDSHFVDDLGADSLDLTDLVMEFITPQHSSKFTARL